MRRAQQDERSPAGWLFVRMKRWGRVQRGHVMPLRWMIVLAAFVLSFGLTQSALCQFDGGDGLDSASAAMGEATAAQQASDNSQAQSAASSAMSDMAIQDTQTTPPDCPTAIVEDMGAHSLFGDSQQSLGNSFDHASLASSYAGYASSTGNPNAAAAQNAAAGAWGSFSGASNALGGALSDMNGADAAVAAACGDGGGGDDEN